MTMSNEECYAIWAPDRSPWSAWAKPVLFSQMEHLDLRPGSMQGAIEQVPSFAPDTALIVDLEGRAAVQVGLELANKGWRPIPLFNATRALKALVDVVPTMEMLLGGAEVLRRTSLPDSAPPAFLLDARRMSGIPRPGDYDNRSITLPQDFPSATLLRSRGITKAVLIQDLIGPAADDLDHVLLRWQQGGIALSVRTTKGATADLVVAEPSMFRKGWYRMIALFGLKRNNVGGFGAMIPEQTSSGFSGGFG